MTDARSISQKRRAEIVLRQGGKCPCGAKLKRGEFHIDHIQAVKFDGDASSDNLRALCLNCHKAKTHHPRGPHTGVGGDNFEAKRAARIAVGGKSRNGPPMPGSRASMWKRRMDGTVVRRDV